MTQEQKEIEILNQEVRFYEGIMKGLSISKVLLTEGRMTNHNIEAELDRYSPKLLHRYQLQDLLSDVTPSALDLIAAEREKQIRKGYTVEHDAKCYPNGELGDIAEALMMSKSIDRQNAIPFGWDATYWDNLCVQKPYYERVPIAGAFVLAELERILYLEQDKAK